MNMDMTEDVTVGEIIEVISYMVSSDLQQLEDFKEATEDSGRLWDSYRKLLTQKDVCDIQSTQTGFLVEANGIVRDNKTCLEKMAQKIEQLKKSQKEVLNTISGNDRHLKKLQASIANINKKMMSLQTKRDIVQICKLLTNTSFVYKGDSVQGYITGPSSKSIYPFEFDSQIHQKKEIVEQLYGLLEKASLYTDGRVEEKRELDKDYND